MHQELARTIRFKRFVRAGLVCRIHMCIAEKQLAVTNVDVGKVNLGSACANAFDFPAMEDEPCFVALLNGVVVSCALIQNARLGVFGCFFIAVGGHDGLLFQSISAADLTPASWAGWAAPKLGGIALRAARL